MSENQAQDGPGWRVYARDWTVVFTSESAGKDGQQEAEGRFRHAYEDKVRPDDWRVETISPLEPDRFPAHLWLRLWLLVSESREQSEAREILGRLSAYRKGLGIWADGDAKVVQRLSAEERELVSYGQKKLA